MASLTQAYKDNTGRIHTTLISATRADITKLLMGEKSEALAFEFAGKIMQNSEALVEIIKTHAMLEAHQNKQPDTVVERPSRKRGMAPPMPGQSA